ncbi:MAG: radical SAM protein [uncultured bacterium]|nr:MAG: radical SAM protein [uncultured bacterium]
MTPEIFNLVFKILPDNAIVMFAGLGEPLLNKHLATYIHKLKTRNISSCIITNGILLTPQRQQELITAGIDQLQISYSGVSTKSLNLIIGSGRHKSTLDSNLQNLALNRPPSLRVQLNFVLFNGNQVELPVVTDLANSWGFDIYIRRAHNRGGNCITNQQEENIKSSCGICAAVTFVTADGKILACSNDVEESSYFKSVTSTTWEDIIAWKKQLLLRELQFKPCLKCNDDYRWLILDYLSVDKNKKSINHKLR